MKWRPPYLVLAAALQAALLAFLAQGQSPPSIEPAQAAAYEGQGEVRIEGVVANVRAAGEDTRIAIEGAGHRVDALVRGTVHVGEGSWVKAVGRLARLGGTLTLLVDDGHAIQAVAPAGVARPSWPDLARDPAAWFGIPISLRGTVERGALQDGEGHRILLGAGAWPKAGPVEATVTLGYEPGCLCHALAAIEVTSISPTAHPSDLPQSPAAAR